MDSPARRNSHPSGFSGLRVASRIPVMGTAVLTTSFRTPGKLQIVESGGKLVWLSIHMMTSTAAMRATEQSPTDQAMRLSVAGLSLLTFRILAFQEEVGKRASRPAAGGFPNAPSVPASPPPNRSVPG